MGDTLRRACWRIRVLRGLRLAVRGLACCLFLSLPLLPARGLLPLSPPLLLGGLATLGLIGGFAVGLLRRLDAFDSARLLDARLHLEDRLATGVELSRRQARSAAELLALAEAAASIPDVRRALPLRLPVRDLAWAGAALSGALLLLALPPVLWNRSAPVEATGVPAAGGEEPVPERRIPQSPRAEPPALAEAARPRDRGMSRTFVPPTHVGGEGAAEFRDTPLSGRRPDFGSFIREGDERLKLLGKSDSIPDLKQGFTRTPYQVAVGRMREMLGERSLKDLSAEELRRLLSEIDRMGRRGGSGLYADDFSGDPEGGMGGTREEALRNLDRALSRLREREGRGGRDRGDREGVGPLPSLGGEEGPEGLEGFGMDFEGMGDAGSLPGTSPSPGTRGLATLRPRGEGVDTALRGQVRDGSTESYNTNVVGRGDRGASRLPHTQVLTRYRQMMEEALTKEAIPPDYREQVKRYFDALEAQR